MAAVSFNQRRRYIDIAKGLCIALIVLRHSPGGHDYLWLIHLTIPMFFFLSGIFFKESDSLTVMLRKKTNKILIPFLFFYTLSWVWHIAAIRMGVLGSENRVPFFKFLYGGFFNNPIWFLLSLFECIVITWGICNIVKNQWLRLALVLICALFGYLTSGKCWAYLNSALTALPFFYLGYILEQNKQRLCGGYNLLSVSLLSGGGYLLGLIFMQHHHIEFVTNEYYGNGFLAYLFSLLIIVFVLTLCKFIDKMKILEYLGTSSLTILCIHQPLIQVLRKIVVESPYQGWIIWISVLLLCSVAVPILNLYLPFFIGQKNLINCKNK